MSKDTIGTYSIPSREKEASHTTRETKAIRFVYDDDDEEAEKKEKSAVNSECCTLTIR